MAVAEKLPCDVASRTGPLAGRFRPGWVLVLAVVSPGCGLVGEAAHNVAFETRLRFDEHAERKRDLSLAQGAWARFESAHAPGAHSADFADGFEEGFADFLYAGGAAAPTVVPPRRYWRPGYQDPAGQQAMHDWLLGFQQGADAARESGYREWMVVPSLATARVSGPGPACAPPLPPTPIGPAEPLPPPRPTEPAPAADQSGVGFLGRMLRTWRGNSPACGVGPTPKVEAGDRPARGAQLAGISGLGP